MNSYDNATTYTAPDTTSSPTTIIVATYYTALTSSVWHRVTIMSISQRILVYCCPIIVACIITCSRKFIIFPMASPMTHSSGICYSCPGLDRLVILLLHFVVCRILVLFVSLCPASSSLTRAIILLSTCRGIAR